MAIRILLVDDHPVVRQGLRTLLEGHSGWEVIGEASDGAEAVEKAKDLNPDVMVLDAHMPYVDGFQVLREMLSSEMNGSPNDVGHDYRVFNLAQDEQEDHDRDRQGEPACG